MSAIVRARPLDSFEALAATTSVGKTALRILRDRAHASGAAIPKTALTSRQLTAARNRYEQLIADADLADGVDERELGGHARRQLESFRVQLGRPMPSRNGPPVVSEIFAIELKYGAKRLYVVGFENRLGFGVWVWDELGRAVGAMSGAADEGLIGDWTEFIAE